MILKFRALHKTWEEMGRITFIRYKKIRRNSSSIFPWKYI